MPDRLDTLIDHAAELQQEVNQLTQEVAALALAGLGLAVVVMLLSWRLWRSDGRS